MSGQGKLSSSLVLQIKDIKEICLLPVNMLELFHLVENIGIEINTSMLRRQELTDLCSPEILFLM